MKTRVVYPQLWLDEKFAQCSIPTKLLFSYLINNLQLGLSRYHHITDRQIMFDTGLTSDQLETGKRELTAIRWMFFTENWVYHNHKCAYMDYEGGDRVIQSKEKEIDSVPKQIKEVFEGLIRGDEVVSNGAKTINHKSKIINQGIIKGNDEKASPKDSKHSLEPCTEEELQEIADSLQAPPENVRETHEIFQEKRLAGELPKGTKTCYYTVKNWVRWDIKKGYVQKREPPLVDPAPPSHIQEREIYFAAKREQLERAKAKEVHASP